MFIRAGRALQCVWRSFLKRNALLGSISGIDARMHLFRQREHRNNTENENNDDKNTIHAPAILKITRPAYEFAGSRRKFCIFDAV